MGNKERRFSPYLATFRSRSSSPRTTTSSAAWRTRARPPPVRAGSPAATLGEGRQPLGRPARLLSLAVGPFLRGVAFGKTRTHASGGRRPPERAVVVLGLPTFTSPCHRTTPASPASASVVTASGSSDASSRRSSRRGARRGRAALGRGAFLRCDEGGGCQRRLAAGLGRPPLRRRAAPGRPALGGREGPAAAAAAAAAAFAEPDGGSSLPSTRRRPQETENAPTDDSGSQGTGPPTARGEGRVWHKRTADYSTSSHPRPIPTPLR